MPVKGLVGRLHPSHFPRTSAHVGSRHIDCSSDRVFLSEFDRVISGKFLDLSERVVPGVDADTSLCSSVRKVDDRTLDGHEAGECFHFLNVNVFGVPRSALGG